MTLNEINIVYDRVIVYNAYSTYRPDVIFILVDDKNKEICAIEYCYYLEIYKTKNVEENNVLKHLSKRAKKKIKNALNGIPDMTDIPNVFIFDNLPEAIECVQTNRRNLTRIKKQLNSWIKNIVFAMSMLNQNGFIKQEHIYKVFLKATKRMEE